MGIGLEFRKVERRENAEIRIGFMQSDGSWSYLGRRALKYGARERTINFGWPLGEPDGLNTALHEIGHALGCPHEHQNPKSGIVWDEAAVYKAAAGEPNYWDEKTTHYNILRKLEADKLEGAA